ncbi:hypothetical protein BC629DRAFT_993373 [Irpex lacteus]|nr:hypothetical protein BC629DRAFT_993373 [Irpex lacteus]
MMMKLADEKDDTREHPKNLPPRIQEPLDDSRIVPCSSLLIASRCGEEKKRKWDASISLINTHDDEEKHFLVTDAERPIEKDLLRDVLLLRCEGNNERSPREGSCCTVYNIKCNNCTRRTTGTRPSVSHFAFPSHPALTTSSAICFAEPPAHRNLCDLLLELHSPKVDLARR